MRKLQRVMLADGTAVWCVQKREVALMYREVQAYLDHGIRVQANDIVFDVGANIGLFTLWLKERLGEALHVYAFEPIPATFAALRCNVEERHLTNVTLLPVGLSDREGVMTFSYYPSAPVISTAYPEAWMDELAEGMLHNPTQLPSIVRWLQFLPIWARAWIIRGMLLFLRAERVICPVTTLSQTMAEQDVTAIDLLKVDVERSEWALLKGIKDKDWPKIRQVVIEVHDINGRVDTVSTLLKERGFVQIVAEQNLILSQSDIVSLYARREG